MDQEVAWLLKEKYHGQTSPDFFSDVDRLKQGEPLAYLIGHVPFLGCQIHLDSRPLIPRPETEFWTEKAISSIEQTIQSNERFVRILDLCAGSGAIGVAVAKAVTEASVTFVEIDKNHLATINKNLKENVTNADFVDAKYNVVISDLFEKIEEKFDFILCNPPYIDPVLDRTSTSVKEHEPHLALYGGVAGLELISKIITMAPNYLNPGGQLWLEHEPEQTDFINNLSKTVFLAQTHSDQYGNDRYTIMTFLASKNMAE